MIGALLKGALRLGSKAVMGTAKIGGKLLKAGGKIIGKGASAVGKAGLNVAKDFGNSVLDQATGGAINVDSFINPISQSVDIIRDEFKGHSNDSGSKPTDRSTSSETNRSNQPSSPKNTVSYKEIPSVTLKSDKKEAIEEFKRHNKEIERLMKLDIDTDEKLGRDEYQHQLELDKAESRRRQDEDAQRKKQLRDYNDAQSRMKSSGHVESSQGNSESTKGETESEGDGGLLGGLLGGSGGPGVGDVLGIGATLLPFLGKGFGKLAKAPLLAAKYVGKTVGKIVSPITKGVGRLATKGLGAIANLGKSVGSKVTSALAPIAKTVTKPITSIGKLVAEKVAPITKAVKEIGGKLLKSRAAKAAAYMIRPKALGKLGRKVIDKLMPLIPKLASKLGLSLAKKGAKSALKQVPFLGIAMGIGEAISDIVSGDYVGAALAALSGIAPTLNLVAPGLGTAISMGAIGADIARDLFADPMKDVLRIFDESDPATIENENDADLSRHAHADESEGGMKEYDSSLSNTNSTQGQVSQYDIGGSLKGDGDISPYLTGNFDNSPSNIFDRSWLGGIGNIGMGDMEVTPNAASGSLKERQKVAFDYLKRELGLTDNQAAGLVGTLTSESQMNPGAVNRLSGGGSDGGEGIAQWTGASRKGPILNYLRQISGKPYSRISQSTLGEQLRAVAWEYKTKRPKSLAALRSKTSINDATHEVLSSFENGGNGVNASIGQLNSYRGGYQGLMNGSNGRARWAKQVYNDFGGNPNMTTNANPVGICPIKTNFPSVFPTPWSTRLPKESKKSSGKGSLALNRGGDVYNSSVKGGDSNIVINNWGSNNSLDTELLG